MGLKLIHVSKRGPGYYWINRKGPVMQNVCPSYDITSGLWNCITIADTHRFIAST